MDKTKLSEFTERLRKLNCPVLENEKSLAEVSGNTLGIQRKIAAVVYPEDLEQIRSLVVFANHHKIAIYTVSQGKNIGYGEMTPVQDNQVVMNLKNMNSIREYDAVNGEVVVEPGVTQAQLAKFLRDQNSPFCADVTGASPDASIIGNTMEAGFGHTPLGDHRKHILNMEVILADGTILNTGEMPCVGPDLSQLFIQSNFGIVTALRIPLFRIPESTVSFSLSFATEDDFLRGLAKLGELRQSGVITSLAHFGNATRTLMSTQRFPEGVDQQEVLDDRTCQEVLSKDSLIKFGAWTGFGGIYGFKAEVREKQKILKRAFKGIAKTRFFTERKIQMADRVLRLPVVRSFKKIQKLQDSIQTIKSLHGLLLGQPTDRPSQGIFWRVKTWDQLGVAWHAPVIPATDYDAALLLMKVRPIFERHKFEMPVTMTLINHKKMNVVFNLNFDKSDPDSVKRAHQAYKELSAATSGLGYQPYRLGLLSDAAPLLGKEKHELLQAIKRALDPNQILAPGRYGLGSK